MHSATPCDKKEGENHVVWFCVICPLGIAMPRKRMEELRALPVVHFEALGFALCTSFSWHRSLGPCTLDAHMRKREGKGAVEGAGPAHREGPLVPTPLFFAGGQDLRLSEGAGLDPLQEQPAKMEPRYPPASARLATVSAWRCEASPRRVRRKPFTQATPPGFLWGSSGIGCERSPSQPG